jgi:hypothetical protein
VLTAIHQILVADRDSKHFKHVAFDRLFAKEPAAGQGCPQDEDHCKHLIQIDSGKGSSLNRLPANNGVPKTVFDTWNDWQSAAPGYGG